MSLLEYRKSGILPGPDQPDLSPIKRTKFDVIYARAVPEDRVLFVWGPPHEQHNQWVEVRDDDFDHFWARQPEWRKRDLNRPIGTTIFSDGFEAWRFENILSWEKNGPHWIRDMLEGMGATVKDFDIGRRIGAKLGNVSAMFDKSMADTPENRAVVMAAFQSREGSAA